MKLAVVGATGATGREVIENALAQGHFVAAVARHPERLLPGERLTSVGGDVLAPDGLAGAFADVDASDPTGTSPPAQSCQQALRTFSPNAGARTCDDSLCRAGLA
jgi:putative NADH-flavin reductase